MGAGNIANPVTGSQEGRRITGYLSGPVVGGVNQKTFLLATKVDVRSGDLYTDALIKLPEPRDNVGSDFGVQTGGGFDAQLVATDYFRKDNGSTNYFVNSAVPVTQTTQSLAVGPYTLWADTDVYYLMNISAGTASITGAGQANSLVPRTIQVTVAGTVVVSISPWRFGAGGGGISATARAGRIGLTQMRGTGTNTTTGRAGRVGSITMRGGGKMAASGLAVTPNVQFLVIGGGGGGGGCASGNTYAGAGGGAGGYRSSVAGESTGGGGTLESALTVSAGVPITVTVGAGGAAGVAGANGGTGGDSVLGTITAAGGGRGAAGSLSATNGQTGGSGGAPTDGGTAGSGTTNQGYASGGAANVAGGESPGGGGAAAAGQSTDGSGAARTGGAGIASSITSSSVTRAKGGDGGAYSTHANGAAVTANTGNGGNGARGGASGAAADGSAGADGFVSLRYPDTYAAAASTTGSPTVTVTGGWRIYTWTTSGSITF